MGFMMADQPPEGERGRYFAYRTGPQSMMISRATGLCDRCQECGCGEQQEPIDLSPAGIMKMVSGAGIDLGQLLREMPRTLRRKSRAVSNGG